MVKNGIQKGRQRFKCFECGRTFQNKQRHAARNARIMRQYVLKRQTLKDIGEQYGKGSRWAQRHIGATLAVLKKDSQPSKHSCTLVADCTFFTRSDGIIVFKDVATKECVQEGRRGWSYTHRRMRSAYRSLMTNLPFLFTHKAHPELSLPNTTNSLDGLFSHMKNLLLVHRGMTKQKRWRLIQIILKKKS